MDGKITVVTCGSLVNESAETLMSTGVPTDWVEAFVVLLCAEAEVVPIKHQELGSPDPNDDALFEAAIVGHADHIVTRERKLLEKLKPHVRGYFEQRGIHVNASRGVP